MRRWVWLLLIFCIGVLGGCTAKRSPQVFIEPDYSFVRDGQAFLRMRHAFSKPNHRKVDASHSTQNRIGTP